MYIIPISDTNLDYEIIFILIKTNWSMTQDVKTWNGLIDDQFMIFVFWSLWPWHCSQKKYFWMIHLLCITLGSAKTTSHLCVTLTISKNIRSWWQWKSFPCHARIHQCSSGNKFKLQPHGTTMTMSIKKLELLHTCMYTLCSVGKC